MQNINDSNAVENNPIGQFYDFWKQLSEVFKFIC